MNETYIEHDEGADIARLLIGRRIVSAENDTLALDDGTTVRVIPNEGCGGCSSGWYHIEQLNHFDAVITSVRLSTERLQGEEDLSAAVYRIFVLAVDKEALLLSVAGDDGNGYYGTGYSFLVQSEN